MDNIFKDEQFNVRISHAAMKELKSLAQKMGMSSAALTRLLIERFCAARREHGDRLVWPPRFAHFAPSAEPWDDALPSRCPDGKHCGERETNPTRTPRRATAADAAPPATPRPRSRKPRRSPKEA